MGELPSWLDLSTITKLGVVVLAVTQYTKKYIPEKWIPLAAMGIGVLVSIAGECCVADTGTVNWVKTILNGILAAVIADTGYALLSAKGGNLTLPSK